MKSLHPHSVVAPEAIDSSTQIPSPQGVYSRWRLSLLFLLIASLTCVGCSTPARVSHAQERTPTTTATSEDTPEHLTSERTSFVPSARTTTPTPQLPEETEQTVLIASSDSDDSPIESLVLPLDCTVNVLVLGSDRRPYMPNWRTDVIMIITLDLAQRGAGVISIPRDVYVDEIPNHRPNRINVVDYLGELDEPDGGGPKLLAGILEEKMGIPIHHYLRFDFEGFKQVVDALGGLEVTLDCPVYDYLPEEDINLALGAGTHRLTGRQALGYVRSRRQGGDLERARRQQRVIWAVRDQILHENLISRVPALYAALHESVQTDISLVTAIRFVRFSLALDAEDVHGMVIAPPDLVNEGWRQGMFVFVADWDLIGERVQTLFDRPSLVETGTVGGDGDQIRCP